MQYLGGKALLADKFLHVLHRYRSERQLYVEPFVGSFNVVSRLDGDRWANDINPYIIALYKAVIEEGWEPPATVSKEEYTYIKDNQNEYSDAMLGFVGFGCSFGGKWFGSYAVVDRVAAAAASRRGVLRKVKTLRGVRITNLDYRDMEIPANSLVYCDPPYADTATVGDRRPFNTSEFWEWCREVSSHSTVLVSELSAPSDFECIWRRIISRPISGGINGAGRHSIEKIYTYGADKK